MSRRIDHRRAEPVHKAPVAVRPVTHVMTCGRSPFELAGHDRFQRTLGAQRRDAMQATDRAAVFDVAGLPSFTEETRAATVSTPICSLGETEEPPLASRPDASLDTSLDARDDSPSGDSDDSRGDSSSESPVPESAPMSTEPTPTPQRTPAPAFAALRGGAGLRGDERKSSTTPAVDGAAALGAADAVPAWLTETAQQIDWLCKRADPAFQTWAVTMPMDPVTLPQTELALNLSHFSITLRFRTHSEHSARLVSRHRGQLQALLEKLPSLPPSIDIDLE